MLRLAKYDLKSRVLFEPSKWKFSSILTIVKLGASNLARCLVCPFKKLFKKLQWWMSVARSRNRFKTLRMFFKWACAAIDVRPNVTEYKKKQKSYSWLTSLFRDLRRVFLAIDDQQRVQFSLMALCHEILTLEKIRWNSLSMEIDCVAL